MTDLSRRDVLAGAAATGLAGLAGCVDDIVQANDDPADDSTPEDNSTPDDETGDGEDSGDGTPGESDGPAVTDVTVETVDSGCLGLGEADITIDVRGDVVEVTGTISAPDPCHEAVLDTTVSDATLSAHVDVEPDDEDESCVKCAGGLDYEATVELSGDGTERVEVSHGDEGVQTTHEVGATPTPTPDPDPTVDDVETLGTDCKTEDETVEASLAEGTLTVEGLMHTSDPCHQATVTGLAFDGTEFTLTVDADAEDGMCQQCVGQVRYEATVDLDGAEPDSLTVDHETGDSHTVDLA